MATKSTINLNYTDQGGRKGVKSITDINPAATGAQLKEFAQKLNALTTNTYEGASRVDKTPLPPAGELKQPNILLTYCDNYTIDDAQRQGKTVSTTYHINRIDTEGEPSGMSVFNFVTFAADTPAVPYCRNVPEHAIVVVQEDVGLTNFTMPEGYSYSWAFAIYIPDDGEDVLGDYIFVWPEADGFASTTRTITLSAD